MSLDGLSDERAAALLLHHALVNDPQGVSEALKSAASPADALLGALFMAAESMRSCGEGVYHLGKVYDLVRVNAALDESP